MLLGMVDADYTPMTALHKLILAFPEAFHETQVPCCLRDLWLIALQDRQPPAPIRIVRLA
jgi:hypothetical protein